MSIHTPLPAEQQFSSQHYHESTLATTSREGALYQASDKRFWPNLLEQDPTVTKNLPLTITKAASKQTFYTIRFLVDRDRVSAAYRAYAYYRWVDDWIDQQQSSHAERLAFALRQQSLVERGYHGEWPDHLTAEEQMLRDLIRSDQDHDSGLQAYIRHMMAVMVFDARRRGQMITAHELNQYSCHLATAVTEALHYFIGHDDPPPHCEARYLPAMAAHITHMLRDTCDDVAMGYYNIPVEFLAAGGIAPRAVTSEPYRAWVKSQVAVARTYFAAGKRYLAQVPNRRCRLAGDAYIARFAGVLDAIEREGYLLHPMYPECKTIRAGLSSSWSVVSSEMRRVHPGVDSAAYV